MSEQTQGTHDYTSVRNKGVFERERAAALAGRLPARYAEPFRGAFDDRVLAVLGPGARVLDIGSGRFPTIEVNRRPPGCTYVGFDISASELELAGTRAYDDLVVADITERQDALVGKFDIVLSWQVLEHVSPLAAALDNAHAYLNVRGRQVAMLSGGKSVFGIANRALPDVVGRWVMEHVQRRDPAKVFPARYDGCDADALQTLFSQWGHVEIRPYYRGVWYFRRPRIVERTYLAYEDWSTRRPNLATHYLVTADR